MGSDSLEIDGQVINFTPGQTIMEAASEAGPYIPHLCHHPDLPPHGSCKLCTVKADGRPVTACTTPAEPGMRVDNDTVELNTLRRMLIELLFAGGNHCCPGCERSGNCQLQALAYLLGMTATLFEYRYPRHAVDASHPDILLDRDRCILCGLCERASRAEGKSVFGMGGRGEHSELIVNTDSGLLGDSRLSRHDLAARICPVAALIVRGEGFHIPIGDRLYDQEPIDRVGNRRPRYEDNDKGPS